jgi:ribosomal protein S6--L-glutamate ligase
MAPKKTLLALGKRLRDCDSVRCLGVKTNWQDYSPEEQNLIREADKIYYPSRLYEALFRSVGKEVFPRNYYAFMGNKIRQTELFQLLEIPHPVTRLYYGRKRAERILKDFSYPFVAKKPLGSSKGQHVWLIRSHQELDHYLANHRPAYIQEYLPLDRDLRVVLVAGRVVHAYWRIAAPGEFRNNVSQGASISYDNIPAEALQFATEVAGRCRFDEVGLDIAYVKGSYFVIEANMVYGLEGFRQVGLELQDIFRQLESEGQL